MSLSLRIVSFNVTAANSFIIFVSFHFSHILSLKEMKKSTSNCSLLL